MLPSVLEWIRSDGHRLDTALRQRLFTLHRPPRILPCWFHGLWYSLISRFARLDVIIAIEGGGEEAHATCRRHRAKTHQHLDELGCIITRLPALALKEMCGCPGVTRVWADREVRTLLDVAVPSTNARNAVSRYSGKGVTIAIMDTGIYPHPDLSGRIIAFKDFVRRRVSPYDDNGHGTHVAGCAAGAGTKSNGKYKGPAPSASLVGVKVLNKKGSGTMSALLSGINWVIQNRTRYGIRIMSMSLGAPAQSGCAADPLCQAVRKAWQAGIICVIAAGNEGPDPRTISTPGIQPDVITVGAMDDRNTPNRSDDGLASFSSRGPTPDNVHKPDLLSPGVAITSLRSPNSYLDKNHSEARVGDWYVTLSGTSMATPVIAGVVALLLETNPGMTPKQVKQRLKVTAQDWHLTADEQGTGYVDVDAMLALH